MADINKNIKITPNISQTSQPNVVYTGQGNVPITMKVLDDSYGTLSFEGSAGQLFSINNNLTSGIIYSVNDVSGIPQFDVNANGTIRMGPYGTGLYVGGLSGSTFTIQPSTRTSSGAGSSIAIIAGSGVTSGAGGSIILTAGIQATSGGDGKVVIRQSSGQTSNIFEVQNSSGTTYESTYIASSVVYKDISTSGSSAPLARLYAGSSEAALFLNGSGRTIKLTANNDTPSLIFSGFGQPTKFYNGASGTIVFISADASTGVVSLPAGGVFDSSSSYKFGHNSSGQTPPYSYSTIVGSYDVNSGNLYVNARAGGANGIQAGHNAELFWVREGNAPRFFVQSIGNSGTKNGFVGIRTESPLGQLHVVAGMNNKPSVITQAKPTNTVTVTNKQLTSNVATLTYSGTGSFKYGETISVTGVDATFNGTFTVTSATTTTVTYNLVSTDVISTASSGTITCSQTANLQEWQNSSGTALAYIDAIGSFYENIISALPVTGTSAGNTLAFAASNASTTGAGGNVTITAGSGSGVGAGGNIILQPGAQGSSGGNGKIRINTSAGVDTGFNFTNGFATYPTLDQTRLYIRYNNDNNYVFEFRMDLGVFGSGPTGSYMYLGGNVTNYVGVKERSNSGTLTVISGSATAGGSLSFPSTTTAFSANTNDLALTASAFQRINCTVASSLTGIAPPTGGAHVDGRMIRIYNVGTANLTLSHNSASSTAANKMFCATGSDIILAPNDYAELIYDSTNNGSGNAGWRAA